MRASHGGAPAFRWILITPLVSSPYSTEGIPRITSTLSMKSVDSIRISSPFARAVPVVIVIALTGSQHVLHVGIRVDRNPVDKKKRYLRMKYRNRRWKHQLPANGLVYATEGGIFRSSARQ